MIGLRFISGMLVGALLTSIYYNPQKTKEIVNKAIDFISKQSQELPKHKEQIENTYQKAKDLQQGW